MTEVLGGASGLVVLLAREQDDGDGIAGLEVEGAGQGGVVMLEGQHDLAADALVRLAVVAHVEVGDVALGHAALVGEAFLEALHDGARVAVLADVQRRAQGLHGVAAPVFAHEREPQALPAVEAPRLEGDHGARGRLRRGPVRGLEGQLEQAQRRTGRGRLHLLGALEIGEGLRELALVLVARRGAQEHHLQEVAQRALVGMAEEQLLRRLHVGRGQRRRVGRPAGEVAGTRAIRIRRLHGLDVDALDRRIQRRGQRRRRDGLARGRVRRLLDVGVRGRGRGGADAVPRPRPGHRRRGRRRHHQGQAP